MCTKRTYTYIFLPIIKYFLHLQNVLYFVHLQIDLCNINFSGNEVKKRNWVSLNRSCYRFVVYMKSSQSFHYQFANNAHGNKTLPLPGNYRL